MNANPLKRAGSAQIAGEQKILAHVIELVRKFPLGHSRHWDAKGNHGATCPLCIEQRAAMKELMLALQEPATSPNDPDQGRRVTEKEKL